MKRSFVLTFLTLLGFLLVPLSDASACAVCFGEKGNHVTDAISWSILFMLGLLVLVLGGIIAFFASIIIRSANHPLPDEELLAVIQPNPSQLPS